MSSLFGCVYSCVKTKKDLRELCKESCWGTQYWQYCYFFHLYLTYNQLHDVKSYNFRFKKIDGKEYGSFLDTH